MQLKVCNPHLSFFNFVSLDEGCDEMLCSGDRCKFIKGFRGSQGFEVLFHSSKKRGEEATSACLHELKE